MQGVYWNLFELTHQHKKLLEFLGNLGKQNAQYTWFLPRPARKDLNAPQLKLRGAIGGKTSKIAVLPWFCKVERDGCNTLMAPLQLKSRYELTVQIYILCLRVSATSLKLRSLSFQFIVSLQIPILSNSGCKISIFIFF